MLAKSHLTKRLFAGMVRRIFLRRMGPLGAMFVLGAAVLAVTGGEALFADLGHFGVGPIRLSWLALVYPALLLNYLGQGAYLLRGLPVLNDNVFYSLVPTGLLVPAILVATAATVIASQALISGIFSLIAQGIVQNLTPNFSHRPYELPSPGPHLCADG